MYYYTIKNLHAIVRQLMWLTVKLEECNVSSYVIAAIVCQLQCLLVLVYRSLRLSVNFSSIS